MRDAIGVDRDLYRRIARQDYMEHGYLDPEERQEMVMAAGHIASNVDAAEQEAQRITRERIESNEDDYSFHIGLGEAYLLNEEPTEYIEEEDDEYEQLSSDLIMEDEDRKLDDRNAEVCFAMEEIDSNAISQYVVSLLFSHPAFKNKLIVSCE